MFYKLIYYIGQRLRNPTLHKHYKFLKASEKYSLKELETYQLEQLQKLVKFAYQHSPYYKQKFDKMNLHPADIKELGDLKKLPILTKKDAIQFASKIHTKANFKKQYKVNTSGTSGKALNFLREEQSDSFNRAAIQRGYSWFGVSPWDKNGLFKGFNYDKFQIIKMNFFDALQNRFRYFSYEEKEVLHFIKKLRKATYAHGFSSMIYEAAKTINQNNLKSLNNLKMLKGTSENIYKHYQAEVIKAFGQKMISEYGAAETGIIAFECPEGNMHITMEGVIVEEIDNEIVVTNLVLKSFPFIRYKLGDYIELDKTGKKCKCGLKHKILNEVIGRVGTLVYGIKRKYPSLLFYFIFINLAKDRNLDLNYQVVQKEKGTLIFNIEESLNEKELLLLENEIVKYFKNDIHFIIMQNVKNKQFIEKKKSFISSL